MPPLIHEHLLMFSPPLFFSWGDGISRLQRMLTIAYDHFIGNRSKAYGKIPSCPNVLPPELPSYVRVLINKH